jgi:spore maturation protein CgeB
MYPNTETWPANIRHFGHVIPPKHASFYSSSPLTLNVTRGTMAAMGYCPSGRLFEAAACGTAVLSDWWQGLDTFFTPGVEILIANTTSEAIAGVTRDRGLLLSIGAKARERALDCHTAEIRAERLLSLIHSPRDESGEREAVQPACKGA